MSGDTSRRPVVIFLSYRRGDTQWAARGIYDRLVNRYGRSNVFRDLDAIPPGARFRDYVEKKISESDVLILLIGVAWAAYQDETGRRRLEHPRDPVRLEVETALRLGVPIIPVRVEGAPMPTERDLVPSIYDLLEFNAAEVTDSRWEYDVDRLLWAIDETVERWLRAPAPKPAGGTIPPVAPPDPATEDRREAEEQRKRQEAEERAAAERRKRRDAEERARRESAERARRDKEKAQREVSSPPTAVHGPAPATESPAEGIGTRLSRAVRSLSRRRAAILLTAVSIGVVVAVFAFINASRPEIMNHLPSDLRAGCENVTDEAATCRLTDGTVVFFRLFDTAAAAEADVVNGYPMASDGSPCPPSDLSVNAPVVCRYAVGSGKGVAMFAHTVKDTHSIYASRWVSEAEPLLRGEMSTEGADPLNWTTLEANWNRLAGSR